MAAFATVTDLTVRWRPLSNTEQATASVLLGDASALIRREYPTIDDDLAADPPTFDADIARIVACEMVKRAMVAGPAGIGVEASQETTGPFATSQTYANPMGNLYLGKADRKKLGIGGGRAFTIDTAPEDSGTNGAYYAHGCVPDADGWCTT